MAYDVIMQNLINAYLREIHLSIIRVQILCIFLKHNETSNI